ncbi:MAG: hypothetical protein ACKOGH_09920 [Alphaproteobacteria bacterium]
MPVADADILARHEAGARIVREAGLVALRHFERRGELAIEAKGL